MTMVSNPRLSTMQVLYSEFVLGFKGRECLFKMRNHQWMYIFWRLGRNKACRRRSADSKRTVYCLTYRILNLPDTLAGMTVFAPAVLNAPSIPWIERLERRIRPMSTETLSSDSAMVAPADCSTSAIE